MHRGHLSLARAARGHLGLDRVLLVPARVSPLKRRRLTAARHRLAMLRLAVRGLPWARVEAMELRRRGPSYTVDTLKAIRRRRPGAELFLILGADAVIDLKRWRRWREVVRLAAPAAAARPGCRAPSGMLRIPMRPLAVSSTAIRERTAAGLSRKVADYAERHGLYRSRRGR